MGPGVRVTGPATSTCFAARWPRCRQFIFGGLALVASLPCAAQSTHLLGFVDTLCDAEAYCFELRVKPEFRELVGERITVRFGSDTHLFDPENYPLTLAQQNIVPGSHLRLLIESDSDSEAASFQASYRASFIWIGD